MVGNKTNASAVELSLVIHDFLLVSSGLLKSMLLSFPLTIIKILTDVILVR